MNGLFLAQGSGSQIAQNIARGIGADSFFITGYDDNLISQNIASNN
jgi:parallel beta-helix repeat protein